jgi:hypothetical protein
MFRPYGVGVPVHNALPEPSTGHGVGIAVSPLIFTLAISPAIVGFVG